MGTLTRPVELLVRGIRNPGAIPTYLYRRLSSKYPKKTVENGVVTWNTDAGFGWGDGETPPQISAINYHMVQALRTDLGDRTYDHALEVGCGYGRVTPWLSEFATSVTGIDPNETVLSIGEEYYPNVGTVAATAQDMPIADDAIDLLVTRSVLQHIPPGEIEDAVGEMVRIATDDARIVICEATSGQGSETAYPRPKGEYAELFEPFTLKQHWQRETHAKTRQHHRTRLLFERE